MRKIIYCLICLILAFPYHFAFGQNIKPPAQPEWDKATADLASSDALAQTAAVDKLKTWIAGGWVSQDLWRKWIPSLTKAGRHQDVADLALLGLLGRPGPEKAKGVRDQYAPLHSATASPGRSRNHPDQAEASNS